MRTRTLLLLAVSCGLAILLAGGIQLLRLANQDAPAPLTVGDAGTAGDAKVTVVSAREAGDSFVVTVAIEGVDDTNGVDGFTLVGVGLTEKPLASGPDDCTGFTEARVECTLTFANGGFETSDRQLLLIRAEDQVRWKLV